MTPILYAGADLRVHPARPTEPWTQARRDQFLLRRDIRRPLSMDPNVWPEAQASDGQTAETPLPWIRVEEVRRWGMARLGADDGSWVLIVLGVVAETPEDVAALARTLGIDTPLPLDPEWEFLGFDVADGATSGLSNCGYKGNEASVLRAAWASRLNDHGLFTDSAEALAYRSVTNARVPEHAPFFVFGLWMPPHAASRATIPTGRT